MDLNFQELALLVTLKLVAQLTEESRQMLWRDQPATWRDSSESRAVRRGATQLNKRSPSPFFPSHSPWHHLKMQVGPSADTVGLSASLVCTN